MSWMYKINKKAEDDLLEKLSDLEHEQWMEWSKSVSDEVSEERKKDGKNIGFLTQS